MDHVGEQARQNLASRRHLQPFQTFSPTGEARRAFICSSNTSGDGFSPLIMRNAPVGGDDDDRIIDDRSATPGSCHVGMRRSVVHLVPWGHFLVTRCAMPDAGKWIRGEGGSHTFSLLLFPPLLMNGSSGVLQYQFNQKKIRVTLQKVDAEETWGKCEKEPCGIVSVIFGAIDCRR